MKLTALKIKAAKPDVKPYKLTDGHGLYLLINPNGSRYWQYKYRFGGKQKTLALGVYGERVPDVSLAEAREKHAEARKLLANGEDPAQVKKARKASQKEKVKNTFKATAEEWQATRAERWSTDYKNQVARSLEQDIYPFVGEKDISTITAQQWLAVLSKIEEREARAMAKKIRGWCSEIYTHAEVLGRTTYNPVVKLASVMKGHNAKHFKYILEADLPGFFASLANTPADPIVKIATRMLIYTGCRTKEVREALWSEIDLDQGIWDIPKEKMKMQRAHIVPLPGQIIEMLHQLSTLTGGCKLLFPGRNDARKPISENTITKFFERAGWHGKVTGHGFRHTFSTILHEHKFKSAMIELQLAHVEEKLIKGVYNHADNLPYRQEMLQAYADMLDALGGNFITVKIP